jgi:hypothetical protein
MNMAELVRSARADGLSLTVSAAGAVKLSGSRSAVDRWAPAIASNKPDIVALLRREAAVQITNPAGQPETASTHTTVATLSEPNAVARSAAETKSAPVAPVPPIGASWPEPKITGKPPFGTDHVPSRYEAGWQALLASCPSWAAGWQRDEAIFSCRALFEGWGAELLRLNWQSKDIFDRWHGLGWFLKGKKVTALGARHAFLEDGRIFERAGR